jgi:hypothetical protein
LRKKPKEIHETVKSKRVIQKSKQVKKVLKENGERLCTCPLTSRKRFSEIYLMSSPYGL